MEFAAGQVVVHYKGGRYRILARATNNETNELYDAIVYQDVTDPSKIWTQSLARFSESVEWEGKTVPRFTITPDSTA